MRLQLSTILAMIVSLCCCDFATAQGPTTRYSVALIGGIGDRSEAMAINDRGEVVGRSTFSKGSNATPAYHAFLFANGQMSDLGVLPGSVSSLATGINNRGVIVGTSLSAYGDIVTDHPFRWSDGRMEKIEIAGAYYVEPRGINDSGQYAGLCNLDGRMRAFIYDDRIIDLGLLPETSGQRSEACGLNNHGETVGVCWTSNRGDTRAFHFKGGKMINLGTLPGHYSSGARGINNKGAMVGYSSAAYSVVPDRHAFLYANGRMIDLNSVISENSGWILREANGINEAGEIVGTGTYGGETHAFLLKLTSK